jgi:hypothetical protein
MATSLYIRNDTFTPGRGDLRPQIFEPAIFKERFCTIERVFTWEDKFRRLLLRFKRISGLHYAFKTLAYTIINLRHYGQICSSAATGHWWNFVPTPRAAIPPARVVPKHRPKQHKSLRHAANRSPLPHRFYTIIAAPANSRRNPQPVVII